MISIAIAEDKPVIAQTLKEKIELSPDFKVSFLAENGKVLLEKLKENRAIDIIFLDINMPEMDGIEAAAEISSKYPHMKIIMCTVFDDEENIFKAIQAGANGYVLKDGPPAKIHRYIYETLDGGAPMSPLIARKAFKIIQSGGYTAPKITSEANLISARETELLSQLSKGLTYEQIAENLHISYGTVRTHFQNIYKKLQVHNKTEAINKAKNEQLI